MTAAGALDDWFTRQADRERSAIRLEDALLGGRFARYFVHRLRFFAVRYGAASVVQLIKVLVLHRLLGTSGFLVVVGLVAVSGLLSGGWWGALEVLRARVRLLYRFESPTAVGREVARWVVLAARLGLLIAAIAALWLAARLVAGGRVGPVDLAVAAVLLRVGLDLPVRAYHAGAFALRRVYRPWTSILALEVLGLGSLLVLVPVAGAWAIGLSELLMASAFAGVALRYASRTHRLLGLAPHRLLSVRAVLGRSRSARTRRAPGRPRAGRSVLSSLVEVARPFAAGVAMALDSLVVLATVSVGTTAGEPWLAVLMAGIAPTIRASFDWAQLVYFDLKRLDVPLFANLRRRLDRATFRLALLLGGLLSIMAIAVAIGPLGIGLGPSLSSLPLLLLGASILGLAEMQAFTAGAYPRVWLGGAILGAGIALLRPMAAAGAEPLLVLAVATLAAAAAVAVTGQFGMGTGSSPEPLPPTAWLTALRAAERPVRVGVAQVRHSETRRVNGPLADPVALREWRATELGRHLALRAGRHGGVTLVDADRVAWFVLDGPRPRISRRIVVAAAAGRLSELVERGATNGPDAIRQLAAWGLYSTTEPQGGPATSPPSEARSEPSAAATDIAALERRFRAQFPAGIVFATDGRSTPVLAALASADRALLLWEAVRHARSLGPRPSRAPRSARNGSFDVTTWCPDGDLRVIFAAPRSAGSRRLGRWRRAIRDANLAAASGGLLPASSGRAPTPAGDTVASSIRGSAPSALATSVATESRLG